MATGTAIQPISQHAMFEDLGVSDENRTDQAEGVLSLVKTDRDLTVRPTMEKADWRHALAAEKTALSQTQHGVVHTWENDRTGWSGEVTTGVLYGINGRQCREVIHTVSGQEITRQFSGISCLNADGRWEKIVSKSS